MNNNIFPEYYGDNNSQNPNMNQQYGEPYGGQQNPNMNQQYGSQPYDNQQYGNQQYGNQQYGNQQYNNTPYQPAQPYAPIPEDPNKKNSKGNWLAGIALILHMLPHALFIASIMASETFYSSSNNQAISDSAFFAIANLAYSIGPAFVIIALILIIIGKCTFPKNKFVTVVFWIILIITILEIVLIIVALIVCFSMIKSCMDGGFPAGFITAISSFHI